MLKRGLPWLAILACMCAGPLVAQERAELGPLLPAGDMAQKAPGRRGKNTNSMSASGNAKARLRAASSMAARLSKWLSAAEPAVGAGAAVAIAKTLAGACATAANAKAPVGAYATTANAAQHSQACSRYNGARTRPCLSRHAASNRNTAAATTMN